MRNKKIELVYAMRLPLMEKNIKDGKQKEDRYEKMEESSKRAKGNPRVEVVIRRGVETKDGEEKENLEPSRNPNEKIKNLTENRNTNENKTQNDNTNTNGDHTINDPIINTPTENNGVDNNLRNMEILEILVENKDPNLLNEAFQEIYNLNNNDSYFTPRSIFILITHFEKTVGTRYFYFTSEIQFGLLMKILKTKEAGTVKMMALEFLLKNFDCKVILAQFIQSYAQLDTFRVDNTSSFRNYAVYKGFDAFFLQLLNGDGNTHLYLFDNLSLCIPFVDFLVRNSGDSLCKNIMLFYASSFLSKIKVDLLKDIKEEIEVDEDSMAAMTKIFYKLESIRKGMPSIGTNVESIGTTAPSVANVDQIVITTAPSIANVGSIAGTTAPSVANVRSIGTTAPSVNYVEPTTGTTPSDANVDLPCANNSLLYKSHLDNFLFLNPLYNSDNPKSIILTIIKRLFYFFLNKNKRVLQTVEIPKMFTKEEKSLLFKQLKNFQSSLINIFKQVDQKYLFRYLKRGSLIPSIFTSINQKHLNSIELRCFYSLYFDYLDFSKDPLEIKIADLELFCCEFNSKFDKSFFHLLTVNLDCPVYTPSLIKFLLFYTKKEIKHGTSISIQLVHQLEETRSIPVLNDILKVLLNLVPCFNRGLISKAVVTLRKLIFMGELTLSSGLLYHGLFKFHQFKDPFFHTEIFKNHPLHPLIYGSVGSHRFPSLFNEHCGDTEVDPMWESALVFYLFHDCSFGIFHIKILESILKKKSKATLHLLVYLNEVDGDEIYNFMAQFISLFYSLLEVNEFVELVLQIFLRALKNKSVLPCMVIPYLVVSRDVGFVFRNYLDSVMNCLNDCLFIMYNKIKVEISSLGEASSTVNIKELEKIFDRENNDFLFTLSKYVSPGRISQKIQYQDDILLIYIILTSITKMSSTDKLIFIKSIEEAVTAEKILEMINKTKEDYGKGISEVSVEYLFS